MGCPQTRPTGKKTVIRYAYAQLTSLGTAWMNPIPNESPLLDIITNARVFIQGSANRYISIMLSNDIALT